MHILNIEMGVIISCFKCVTLVPSGCTPEAEFVVKRFSILCTLFYDTLSLIRQIYW